MPEDRSIVEREFETDDKGRTMVVCALCGEVRPYKTRGEGRCCMRTTHDWRPIAKKPDVGQRVVFKKTGDQGIVTRKSWDSDGIMLRVHFDDSSPGTWGEYYTRYFELLEEKTDAR